MKFVFVLQDAAPAALTIPVLGRLQQRGHAVGVHAEGIAIERLLTAGFQPGLPLADLKQLWWGQDSRPDMLVTGLSYPMGVEESAALEAYDLGIPVAVLSDIAGAERRMLGHLPSLVFTPTLTGSRIAHDHMPQAAVHVVGDVNARRPEVLEATRQAVARLSDGGRRLVVVYTESGSPEGAGLQAVYEQIDLLGACIDITSREVCVVPRLHPKWKKTGYESTTLHEHWSGLIRTRLANVVSYSEGDTAALCVCEGVVTVSGFSGLLTTAAYCGNTAVSLMTPSTKEFMEETGIPDYPEVAAKIDKPVDLASLAMPEVKLVPYNPALVADELVRQAQVAKRRQ